MRIYEDAATSEWVLKLLHPQKPVWKGAPLLSDAVILAWFKRLKPDVERNTLNVYKGGVSWATDARNPDTQCVAMVPVNGAKSDVRVLVVKVGEHTYKVGNLRRAHYILRLVGTC